MDTETTHFQANAGQKQHNINCSVSWLPIIWNTHKISRRAQHSMEHKLPLESRLQTETAYEPTFLYG